MTIWCIGMSLFNYLHRITKSLNPRSSSSNVVTEWSRGTSDTIYWSEDTLNWPLLANVQLTSHQAYTVHVYCA